MAAVEGELNQVLILGEKIETWWRLWNDSADPWIFLLGHNWRETSLNRNRKQLMK